jgi:hypothetical protein
MISILCSLSLGASAAQSIFALTSAEILFEGQAVSLYDASDVLQENPFPLVGGNYHDAADDIIFGDASASLQAGALSVDNETGVAPVYLEINTVIPMRVSGFGYDTLINQYSNLVITNSDSGFMIMDPIGTDDHIFLAVPEPAAWATMLLGIAAVGGVLRRNRPASAAYLG